MYELEKFTQNYAEILDFRIAILKDFNWDFMDLFLW